MARLEITANKMEVYPDGNGGFKIPTETGASRLI